MPAAEPGEEGNVAGLRDAGALYPGEEGAISGTERARNGDIGLAREGVHPDKLRFEVELVPDAGPADAQDVSLCGRIDAKDGVPGLLEQA